MWNRDSVFLWCTEAPRPPSRLHSCAHQKGSQYGRLVADILKIKFHILKLSPFSWEPGKSFLRLLTLRSGRRAPGNRAQIQEPRVRFARLLSAFSCPARAPESAKLLPKSSSTLTSARVKMRFTSARVENFLQFKKLSVLKVKWIDLQIEKASMRRSQNHESSIREVKSGK